MTTTANKRKGSLRLVLAVAAALGCSSATLSGALSVLALQQPVGSQAKTA